MSSVLDLLHGASGANLGSKLGGHFERSCQALSDGFKKGTTLKIDAETRKILQEIAKPSITISPATFTALSDFSKQFGFITGGTGAMLGGIYSLIRLAHRYFEKETPTTYGDLGLAVCGVATVFAGAATVYHSNRLTRYTTKKNLHCTETQTGTTFEQRTIKRRHSFS
ncbi:MAG: hypothetical protein K2X90_04225 [Candidatus Babeliaceae bacterium]|nr:hypothetical protein [Candidatus Babeliaceae bacterium]